MTIYSLDILLFLFGTSLLFHVQFFSTPPVFLLLSHLNFTQVWIQSSRTHCSWVQPGRNPSFLLQFLWLYLFSRLFQQGWPWFSGSSEEQNYFQPGRMKGDLLEEVAFAWALEGRVKCKSGQSHREKRKQYASKQVEMGKHSMYRNIKTVNCTVGKAPWEPLGCNMAFLFQASLGWWSNCWSFRPGGL